MVGLADNAYNHKFVLFNLTLVGSVDDGDGLGTGAGDGLGDGAGDDLGVGAGDGLGDGDGLGEG